MARLIDLTNKTFGRLKVLNRENNSISGQVIWKCKCICNKIINVQGGNLKSKQTTSCGCYRDEVTSKRSTSHGMTKSSEFISWSAMLSRCINQNDPAYNRYGGRGIVVCDRWKDSFENFYEDMGPKPSDKHSIDRISVDGNYEPNNCKWSNSKDQARNRRSNKIKNIEQANEIRKLYSSRNYYQKELAEIYGCSIKTISEIVNNDTWKINKNPDKDIV